MRCIRHAVLAAAFCTGLPIFAGLIGTTETFNAGAANWQDASKNAVVWSATGSFDNSAFISASASFTSNVVLDPVVLFRAEITNLASNSAFVGDYITQGVTGISFRVRHNATTPINMFVRYAEQTFAAFPGIVVERFIDIPAGTWQQIDIPLAQILPEFKLTEEVAGSFNTVMSNVANLQFGVTVNAGLAGLAGPFTFDLDQVTLVPTPGSGAILTLLAASGLRRRRRSCQ
jgi:hypothetical protein